MRTGRRRSNVASPLASYPRTAPFALRRFIAFGQVASLADQHKRLGVPAGVGATQPVDSLPPPDHDIAVATMVLAGSPLQTMFEDRLEAGHSNGVRQSLFSLAVDAAEENIEAARAHAQGQGLEIDYRVGGVETLDGPYALITSMEVVEHVADVPAFLAHLAAIVPLGEIEVRRRAPGPADGGEQPFDRGSLREERTVDLRRQPGVCELTGSLVIDHARGIGYCGLGERCDVRQGTSPSVRRGGARAARRTRTGPGRVRSRR